MCLNQFLEICVRICTILAIIGGCIWAYYNYLKGRIHKPRLSPSVEAKILNNGNDKFLLITIALRNVGLSKISITQTGTALRLLYWDSEYCGDEYTVKNWRRILTMPILENHQWIEPSEYIEEQYLIPYNNINSIAFRFELYILSKNIEWDIIRIIENIN